MTTFRPIGSVPLSFRYLVLIIHILYFDRLRAADVFMASFRCHGDFPLGRNNRVMSEEKWMEPLGMKMVVESGQAQEKVL